ncbi:NAD-dependent epimerase/dehydratase family protein [Sphingomonas sp. LB-2]|uniref:NAD-dependent epimerase/dehydratase family protein n=1 Tax=Sphingomonas caeni TaxID=2984949 RepID=UPI0022322DBA|nr:NAD-dependent epimerase/dehydratase family protein [Sphingomonas caeni]MCW3846205.1 NAD-dependent epimerase/dehydratase family protein [Sphingomonas caeni]
MTETVLVTGGSGYIGGWCVVELLRRGYEVRTTVRSLSKEAAVRAAIAAEVDPEDRLRFFAAELTSDAGWDEAVAGCDYVLHVASPLGTHQPKDPQELIVPAREGALRALRAAAKAGVKRVVLTSSVSAASPAVRETITDEAVWTDVATADAYSQSKTLAEQAAWEFAAAHPELELVTVLPSLVIGPVLTPENMGSVQLIWRLMAGKVPGNPRLGFTLVDVRDVVDVHLRAMTAPEAKGGRFIAANRFMWMADVSKVLRERLGAKAAKVPTRNLPSFVLRFMAMFDRTLRLVTPGLGRSGSFSSAKARAVLGWTPIPVEESIVDCAESLIAKGAV